MVTNHAPETAPRSAYRTARDAEMKMFSRRLWRLMTAKGWNQSELARRSGVGRDMISGYIRAKHLPEPPHAKKLAEAFGVEIEELFPSAGETASTTLRDALPPVELRATSEGKAMLHVNLEVPFDVAVQVLALIQGQRKAEA